MAELQTKHQFYYDTTRPLRLWEIAEALIATEAILTRTGPVLEELFPGTTIEKIEVLLDGLRSGSLYEDLFVKFFFGSQDKLDEVIHTTRRRLGMDRLAERKLIVGAIFLALVLYGGRIAVGRLFGPKEARDVIEINNSTIIVVGAELADVAPEQLRQIIEKTTKDGGKLANEAIRVLRPAKGTTPGALIVDQEPRLTILPETIETMPSQVFPDKPEERLEPYKNVELEIRATDLDSFKKGWAALIPEVAGKRRVPLQIAPDINTTKLGGGKVIRGDVTVIFAKVGGREVARRAYLSAVSPIPSLRPVASHARGASKRRRK
jgi:hypothetical protein